MAQAPSMPPDTGNGGDLGITLGVEEEFFLVDPESRDLLVDPDLGIFEICEKNSGPHKVVRELLRTQIETNTRVCESVAGVREALRETRRLVAGAAEEHGGCADGCLDPSFRGVAGAGDHPQGTLTSASRSTSRRPCADSSSAECTSMPASAIRIRASGS